NEACAEYIPTEMGKVITWFTQHGVDAVYEQPDMTDERSLAIINILDNLSPPAYVSGETNLWILHVLFKANLTIEMGLSPQGGYAFVELGLLFFILGNYTFADPCAQLSMRIVEKFQATSPRHLSRTGHLYTNYCSSWVRHIGEAARLNPRFYNISLDTGELIYAGYTSFFPHYTSFYQGKDALDVSLARLPEALDFTKKIKHDLAHDSLKALHVVMRNLSGKTSSVTNFDAEDYTEAELLTYCQSVSDFFAITIFNVYKAYALYIQGEIASATSCIETALAFAAAMAGCPVIHTLFNFTHSLTLLADSYEDEASLDAAIATVEANQVQMKLWADNNEANFSHKYLLVEAELARVRGEDEKASRFYSQSIALADKHDFSRESAVAHVCAAKFWRTQRVNLYVQAHAEHAIAVFDSLGYMRYAQHLQRDFAEYVMSGSRHTAASAITTRTVGTNQSAIETFDVRSLMKSARALSESIELDALIDRMLHIVIENVGAQRAVLIVQEFGAWHVRAEVDINNGQTAVYHDDRLDQSKLVPVSIINYVIRTQNSAHSNSPIVQKSADRDPYIAAKRATSFFCLPLTHQGETNAIVYAEHGTGTDFITEDRVEIMHMLTSLMAVALDNASLYRRQTELVDAAQRFVPQDFIRALGHQSLLQVKLGDSIKKDMTVLFGDIRSYSSIAENLSVENNFKFINSYLQAVGPVIRRNNGFINHYHGDGYMALFPGHPEDALNATIEIAQALVLFNQSQVAQGMVPIRVGFGIHTGRVMMGIIGDGERQDANVISNAVNTASRLEGMTKNFAATVFLSEQTLSSLKDADQYQTRFIGKMRLVGMEDVTNVYELFSADDASVRMKKQQTLPTYAIALKDYYDRRFAEAALSFRKIIDEYPDDHSSKRFLDLAAHYMINGVPADWQGVETLSVK
ncbi:MAG: GAF domain-containing protein, partial [Candidatus Kapabacteria bacterium]|nr:GAF domain-containing protein [Candidatus Kapabacteria bacterium]